MSPDLQATLMLLLVAIAATAIACIDPGDPPAFT